MARRKGEACKKCGQITKKNEEKKMVVDVGYYDDPERKAPRRITKTFYSTLCTDCLKEFLPIIKEYGFERKACEFSKQLGLG